MLRLDVHGTMFEIVLKSMPPVQTNRQQQRLLVVLIARWWRRGCGTGNRADRPAGRRANGSTRTAAGRSPNRRPCSCTDQTTAKGALAGIVRVCAPREPE
jgi:hypothetical protein